MFKIIFMTILTGTLSFNSFATNQEHHCFQDFKAKESKFLKMVDEHFTGLETVSDYINFSENNNSVIYQGFIPVVRLEIQLNEDIIKDVLLALKLNSHGPKLDFFVNGFYDVAFRYTEGSATTVIAEFGVEDLENKDSIVDEISALSNLAVSTGFFLKSIYGDSVSYNYSIAQSNRTDIDGGFANREVNENPFKWWNKEANGVRMSDNECEQEVNLLEGLKLIPEEGSHRTSNKHIEVTFELGVEFLSDFITRYTKFFPGQIWVQKLETGTEQARQPVDKCEASKVINVDEKGTELCSLMEYKSSRIVFGLSDNVDEDVVQDMLDLAFVFHGYYQVVSRYYETDLAE